MNRKLLVHDPRLRRGGDTAGPTDQSTEGLPLAGSGEKV